jgi:hypothetical protein
VDAIFNRGVVMFRKGNLIAADRWFRQAAKRDPLSSKPLINLALVYRYWGRLEDAHRCLTHVVEREPDLVDAQWNLANLELLQGNLKDGFPRTEWRFKRAGFKPPVRDLPRWDGTVSDGTEVLLVAEQGLGDTIQMARFAKVLSKKGVRVGIEAQTALHSILATVPGVSDVFAPGEPAEIFTHYVPVMSFPGALGIVEETIPASVPYIHVPGHAAAVSHQKKQFSVGVVWRGNAQHETDRLRSIPLAAWSPVLATPGVDFISLQVGPARSELSASPWADEIVDPAAALTDFSDTAAWIAHLDLIITVDTAVAHLAGAMGKPVWLLISPANDWRWMTNRADSPWYPTMRIFRG